VFLYTQDGGRPITDIRSYNGIVNLTLCAIKSARTPKFSVQINMRRKESKTTLRTLAIIVHYYECEKWSVLLTEDRRLRMVDNMVLM